MKQSSPEDSGIVNGWRLYAHPLFVQQLDTLEAEVEVLQKKDPKGYGQRNAAKRLYAITKLVFEIIPQDPTLADYRQGAALGPAYRHWFRAKFYQQYRLFFRYHTQSRVIVYAWVNDASTLRAYESRDDAYRTFQRMLRTGNPPDNWDSLLRGSNPLSPSAP